MEEKTEVDFEKLGRSLPVVQEDTDNNNNKESKQTRKLQCSQCLLKGDKVFSLNLVEKIGWSSLFRYQLNCKYVNGMVVSVKDWVRGRLALEIVWEHGGIEQLRQNTSEIAYTDRVFVLDRERVAVGSRVKSLETPGKEGVVLEKRYLATGITKGCANHEMIFEDIDVKQLCRETYGAGYKDIKILYHGWIGITSEYRTRLYLEMKNQKIAPTYFTIVVDGNTAQNLAAGDQITLGFAVLRNADFIGGEAEKQSWLANFWKYYNSTVTVMDLELDQLTVCWIGEESIPNGLSDEFEMPDSPSDIITYDHLPSVQYLVGDYSYQVTPKSLWTYQGCPELQPKTKETWARKWRAILDLERWEYPDSSGKDDFDQNCYCAKSFTLEIMYVRSTVRVQWNDESDSVVNCGDVIPSQVGSVWSEMLSFRVGSVVRNRLDPNRNNRYGIVTNCNIYDNIANVKWIVPGCGDEAPIITASPITLYNLEEIPEYDYLLKPFLSPLVSCKHAGSNVMGVILGMSSDDYKARVRLVNNIEQLYWPHELVHYKCDMLYCPVENRWRLWYNHLASSVVTIVNDTEDHQEKSEDIQDILATTIPKAPKSRFESVEKIPSDNVFVGEELFLRRKDADFRFQMEVELDEMENRLPEGMWMEHYLERVDIFSALLTGPKGTIFEDYIFIFDIFIMENFPKSEPHVNFRSMGITVIPSHLMKSGAVELPEKTARDDEDFTVSYIVNVLLEVKDFMGLPLEQIHEESQEDMETIGIGSEKPEELYKYVTLALVDYTIAILMKPPKNWAPTIFRHFSQALPRIIERLKKGYTEIRRPCSIIRDERGTCGDQFKYETSQIYWNQTFLKSISSRITSLEEILSQISHYNPS